jgi:hypothetical protein
VVDDRDKKRWWDKWWTAVYGVFGKCRTMTVLEAYIFSYMKRHDGLTVFSATLTHHMMRGFNSRQCHIFNENTCYCITVVQLNNCSISIIIISKALRIC